MMHITCGERETHYLKGWWSSLTIINKRDQSLSQRENLAMASWTRQQDSQPFETIELIVSGIIPIILLVFGTLGNILCTIILLQKRHRQFSTNIYILFLCLMDTLSLYQWNLSYALYTVTGGKQKITDQSLFLCKWGEFLSFYTLHTSAMFLTLASFDRACLLWSGWYKRKVARTPVALIICVIVLLVLFALNGFLFALGIDYTVYNNSTGEQMTIIICYYSLDSQLNHFFANGYTWVSRKEISSILLLMKFFVYLQIHLVLMYFVPFTVMFLCTVITAKKLLIRHAWNNQQMLDNARRNRRITIMLLLMCLAYVILTLPNRLCFSIFSDQILGHAYTDTVFLSSNTLMYTRNALNVFFLYISVAGVRRDIHRLILACHGKMRGRVRPLETSQEARPKTIHDPGRDKWTIFVQSYPLMCNLYVVNYFLFIVYNLETVFISK